MKAVIVEIREKYAAALSDDGCIIKCKDKNYEVGQVIYLKKAQNPYLKYAARVAGIVAAVAVTSLSAWAYCTPYSYVSLDVNPSIEYSLNRFDYVLSCSAVNGDGEEILNNLRLKNISIEKAIEATIKEIAAQGYLLGEEPGGIVIAAAGGDETKSQKLAQELKTSAKAVAEEQSLTVEIVSEGVGKEQVAEAREKGVTPGKLNLVQKLQESAADEEEVNTQDWLKKPVKEIMRQIQENKDKNDKSEKESKSGKEDNSNKEDQSEKENRSGIDPRREGQQKAEENKAARVTEQKEQEKNKNTNINQNREKRNDRDNTANPRGGSTDKPKDTEKNNSPQNSSPQENRGDKQAKGR